MLAEVNQFLGSEASWQQFESSCVRVASKRLSLRPVRPRASSLDLGKTATTIYKWSLLTPNRSRL